MEAASCATSSAVSFSGASRRPSRAIELIPLRAKLRAAARPIPEPPPVMRTDLLAVERAGFLGLMDG